MKIKKKTLTGVTMRFGESCVILAQCDSNDARSDCSNTWPRSYHTRTRTRTHAPDNVSANSSKPYPVTLNSPKMTFLTLICDLDMRICPTFCSTLRKWQAELRVKLTRVWG